MKDKMLENTYEFQEDSSNNSESNADMIENEIHSKGIFNKLWNKIMKIPYGEIPEAIKGRIYVTLFGFGGIGIVALIVNLINYNKSFVFMAIVLLLFAIFNGLYLLFQAGRDNIIEIEGVITQKEKKGVRKGEYDAYVQTAEGDVYKIFLTKMYKDYKRGHIIRFYTLKEGSRYCKDGVINLSTIYAMERLSAKVTTDEEDQYINQELEDELENELEE